MLARSSTARARAHLGPKALRELWRHANEASLPVRSLKSKATFWGTDRTGQDLGAYPIARFEDRTAKAITLTTLEVASRSFREAKDCAGKELLDPVTKEKVVVTEKEYQEEKARRKEMAALKMELYGQGMGKFAQNPEWDDVEPIPQDEPEKALAAIAYPTDYAEGTRSPTQLSLTT